MPEPPVLKGIVQEATIDPLSERAVTYPGASGATGLGLEAIEEIEDFDEPTALVATADTL
jgi:hypothetical protein